jgi:hypothetical protein
MFEKLRRAGFDSLQSILFDLPPAIQIFGRYEIVRRICLSGRYSRSVLSSVIRRYMSL